MQTAHNTTFSTYKTFRSSLIVFLIVKIYSLCTATAFAQTESMKPEIERNYQARPYQGQLETDDGQWIRPAKDYASTRYSSLEQINAKNAKDLRLAFTFSTGMTHGHEAAPLVVGNTMYIVTHSQTIFTHSTLASRGLR